jgi:flavin-dependent dehydrogenase
MTHPTDYDVIIIGAGPSGCSCAMHLANSGLKIAVIDKARFPRDKICGDGLSLKTIQALERLPGNFIQKFIAFPKKVQSQRAMFISYNEATVTRQNDFPNESELTGYVCRRYDFDYLLIKHLKEFSNITVIEGFSVTDVKIDKGYIKVIGEKGVFTGKIAVGAFGVNIKLSYIMTGVRYARRDLSYACRAYFKNVGGFRWDNAIELYFLEELLPGFVWLFPLENNTINAGLGLKSTNLKKRIKSPGEVFEKFINNNAALKKRFKDAPPGPILDYQ